MLVLRSLVFNALFYVVLIGLMIVGLPALLFGRHAVFGVARAWARSSLWLLKVICGLDTEFRGMERLPEGGYILAPKHQSIWETFALTLHAKDFSYILKRELTLIPVFGWYLKAAEQIAINRSSGRAALTEATSRAREVLGQGRQIFIFPEGTRRPAGAPPLYKFGVAAIYADTCVPCVPVALNSGLFWARRSFVRRPGKIVVEYLEPIPPGLGRDAFLSLLQERMESATNRLIAEAVRADPSLAEVVARAQRVAPAT
jgi:1-acyl-sn-glycerol-3-phosphate acyltransferase